MRVAVPEIDNLLCYPVVANTTATDSLIFAEIDPAFYGYSVRSLTEQDTCPYLPISEIIHIHDCSLGHVQDQGGKA